MGEMAQNQPESPICWGTLATLVTLCLIYRQLNWFKHGFQHSRPDLSVVDDANHAARSFEEWKDDEWVLHKTTMDLQSSRVKTACESYAPDDGMTR